MRTGIGTGTDVGTGTGSGTGARTARTARVGVALGLALALAGGAAVGCAENPTERWKEAVEDLEQVREDVQQAEETVATRREALREAEAGLAEARQREQEAEARLDEARAHVSAEATDEVLFRAVQKSLLEDDALKEVAISAQVRDGVVTLRGTVPDAELRDRAVKVARQVPGVADVESQIRVSAPAEAPEEAT